MRIFLKERLHLEMSEEKTEITHASKPVGYLGYDFKVMRSKSMKRCKNGDMKRVWNGKVFLYVPKEKWVKKAMGVGRYKSNATKAQAKKRGSRQRKTNSPPYTKDSPMTMSEPGIRQH